MRDELKPLLDSEEDIRLLGKICDYFGIEFIREDMGVVGIFHVKGSFYIIEFDATDGVRSDCRVQLNQFFNLFTARKLRLLALRVEHDISYEIENPILWNQNKRRTWHNT